MWFQHWMKPARVFPHTLSVALDEGGWTLLLKKGICWTSDSATSRRSRWAACRGPKLLGAPFTTADEAFGWFTIVVVIVVAVVVVIVLAVRRLVIWR